jgi:hypothetical protein
MKLVINEIRNLNNISSTELYKKACGLKYDFHVSDLLLHRNKILKESLPNNFIAYSLSGDAMKIVTDFHSNCSLSIHLFDIISCYYAGQTNATVLTDEPLIMSIADTFDVGYITMNELQNKILMKKTG